MKERILFDTVLEKIPNKYVLTIVTGKRVRELTAGATPTVKTKGKSTLVQVAMKEILEGKVVSKVVEEENE